MSKLKVNELDTRSGTTITVTTGKTVSVPVGATITVAGTQTVTGTVNLTASTLTLPVTLPATAGTNITSIPGANITGTIPAAALTNVALGPLEDDIAVLGFQVAAASDLAKFNLRDQIVDTFQDATGVDASASTNEIRDITGKYWYGGTVASGITGGTITTQGGYTVHSFLYNTSSTTDQAFTIPAGVSFTGSVLLIAGGGGGGTNYGGGGGAGGMRIIPTVSFVASTTYNFRIGDGGAGSSGSDNPASGRDGANSTLIGGAVSESATGGGGGGGNGSPAADDFPGRDGGSGGGMKHGNPPYSAGDGINDAGTFGTATYQGNDGGTNTYTGGGGENCSGGGGAGGAGLGDLGVADVGGAGGVGRVNDYRTGSDVYYAGGGGGKGDGGEGAGGTGGGGQGGNDATDHTGGGGGGSDGDGGTGIGVVRFTAETAGANLTLVSTATTAEAGTTATGDVVMLYTPATGTVTLNTDLKAYVSRDDGTTYTQATLVGKGSYSGTTEIASAHDVDISGQPAGVTMRWKIETLNQNSASKVTRVNGMSLGWS